MLDGPHILHTGVAAKKLVVILHGYGADGANLLDLATCWAPYFPDADFLVPNAPEICEINPFGFQWFGLRDLSPFNVTAGLDKVRPILVSYLSQELDRRNLTPKDLILVGFSQGGILALDMLFAFPGLGGVISYSGAFYAPVAASAPKIAPPVLLVHGVLDVVVPFSALAEADRQLRLFDIKADVQAIKHLGHGIDDQGVRLGTQFLSQIFTQSQSFSGIAQ